MMVLKSFNVVLKLYGKWFQKCVGTLFTLYNFLFWATLPKCW